MNLEPFQTEVTLQTFFLILFICIFGLNWKYFCLNSVIFTFNEYFVHRFLLHQTNVTILSKNHLYHHLYPKQWTYMHISSVSTIVYLLFWGIALYFLKFSFQFISSSLSTHFFWYLWFIFFHLFGHLFGKNYFHSLHHLKPNYNFGFCCHFWDVICGTFLAKLNAQNASFYVFHISDLLLLIPFPFIPLLLRQFFLNCYK